MDLPAEFRPTPSLQWRTSYLPGPPTPLIGRAHEASRTRRLLLQDGVGLVTLTGAGGSGKSRLALAVAADLEGEFEDGVHFVSLAPIGDPGLVIAAIAQTLGLREAGHRALHEILKHFLHRRRLLLVLDNFEQVIQAAPLVADLLTSSPRLKILVTSREVLRLSGEYDVLVPPLALPGRPLPPPDKLRQYDAIRLFIERAQAARSDFTLTAANATAVAEICARLDGLPLAIELAASRIRLLPPQALLARLERRLPLLVGGARDLPVRHQTLRGTIDWSYSLLSVHEQAFFRRLAVFVGGCTLTGVEAVIGRAWQLLESGRAEQEPRCLASHPTRAPDVLEGLELLIDKSLLRQEEQFDGQPRYLMLETIREYALEQLHASGESELIRRCHAEHFLALAEAAEEHFWGPQLSVWNERVRLDVDNVRTALEWSVTAKAGAGAWADSALPPVQLGLGLAGGLCRYWDVLGRISEGRERLTALLTQAPEPTALRAKALNAAGFLAWSQGDVAAARVLLKDGLALARQHEQPEQMAFALVFLGCSLQQTGDLRQALAHLDESLSWWDRAQSPGGRSLALFWLGDALRATGDHEDARSRLREGLALSLRLKDYFGAAFHVAALGRLASSQGDHASAIPLLRQALTLWRDLGDVRDIGVGLDSLALAAAARGQARMAARLFGAASAVHERPDLTRNPIWEDDHSRVIEATRTRLGETAFTAMWEEGRALPLQLAIEEALAFAHREASGPAPPPPVRDGPRVSALSARERQVAALIAQGYGNVKIGAELSIGRRTVESHVTALLNKLGLSNRTQVARWVIEHDLQAPDTV